MVRKYTPKYGKKRHGEVLEDLTARNMLIAARVDVLRQHASETALQLLMDIMLAAAANERDVYELRQIIKSDK